MRLTEIIFALFLFIFLSSAFIVTHVYADTITTTSESYSNSTGDYTFTFDAPSALQSQASAINDIVFSEAGPNGQWGFRDTSPSCTGSTTITCTGSFGSQGDIAGDPTNFSFTVNGVTYVTSPAIQADSNGNITPSSYSVNVTAVSYDNSTGNYSFTFNTPPSLQNQASPINEVVFQNVNARPTWNLFDTSPTCTGSITITCTGTGKPGSGGSIAGYATQFYFLANGDSYLTYPDPQADSNGNISYQSSVQPTPPFINVTSESYNSSTFNYSFTFDAPSAIQNQASDINQIIFAEPGPNGQWGWRDTSPTCTGSTTITCTGNFGSQGDIALDPTQFSFTLNGVTYTTSPDIQADSTSNVSYQSSPETTPTPTPTSTPST